MIRVRRAGERGHADHGWLDTWHTFSFAGYHDPAHMGFRALRVINDDTVAPGTGFGAHAHRDMEIITYVLTGGLAHKDSMGNASVIRPGNVQRMSAGTGVTHAEFNASEVEPVHFLQIWILPERSGLPPSYEEKEFARENKRGALRLIAAPDGRDGAATIHQDARVYASVLEPGERLTHRLAPGRHAWLHVISGAIGLGDVALAGGDGAAVSDETALSLTATAPAELLLFDLA
ncbi:MAG: quercetin 2,3-dioxygenase [Candidatus Rokubacteria bacterium GWC2_70_16]|nr:MAG: quercetin 2,3-dioxygenase [Candidatus Rokubacteria bacterium GWC2_70_16]OGL19905.1 MAG: quercetin 2,3-dioxygenase [Candidatus Rokubacteria bacterium RIFCSPLOWO2_12_FULL_71_19]